jgi:hypothetical protein
MSTAVAQQIAQGPLRTQVLTPRMTPVSWEPNGELDLETWARVGARLASQSRAADWWVGDWIRYGNARFGEKYARAEKLTRYDRQTLMNKAYVAARFEISRRRETLSWSHHADLAALTTEEQEHWLDVAEQERLSVRCLRSELRRRRDGGKDAPSTNASKTGITCPQCGHYLELTSAFESPANTDAQE